VSPQAGFHESITRGSTAKAGSDRTFGLVFAGFFTLVAAAPLLRSGEPRWWALAAAAAFLVVGLTIPRLLRPLNLLWFRFGLLLHAIVSPVILGVFFFLVIASLGLAMRAAGKRPLNLSRDPAAPSYWILRTPPGPAPETMKNQF
jgi:hypothetical protein